MGNFYKNNMIPKHLYINKFLTGSQYICNPPVMNTDKDEMYLVYALDEVIEHLDRDGWKPCGIGEYAIGNWCAYRKATDNILITDDKVHYDKFEAATELAKKRNLVNKQDRVNLFNLIVGK